LGEKNYFERPDGLTEIFPVYPENIPTQKQEEEKLGHYVPFSDNENDSLFCIRDAIALPHPKDKTLITGLIAFEICPESWTLTYVHTEELNGFEQVQDDDGTMLDEFDFEYVPIERIHDGFQGHILQIMKSCVDYMNQHPELSNDQVDAIENTIRELNNSDTTHFIIDIYIPPKLCDLTGERYFRPGGELYRSYDNPIQNEDFEPSKIFKSFLCDIITKDIPELGLTLACDEYLRAERLFEIKEEKRKG